MAPAVPWPGSTALVGGSLGACMEKQENLINLKKERDELVSKKKKDGDESEFGTKSVGEMNDVEMTTT